MNTIILGVTSGYPDKISANASKADFIARGLIKCGYKACIINALTGEKGINKVVEGCTKDGVEYIQFPIKKRPLFLLNVPSLVSILKRKKAENYQAVIMGMDMFPIYATGAIISKLIGYKRSVLFHEWHIGFANQKTIMKIDAYIKDYLFGYFLNGIFPISHFLYNKASRFKKPMMYLPVTGSFNGYRKVEIIDNCFTYCGQASYSRVIFTILDAFNLFLKDNTENASLNLVLHGSKKHLDLICKYIDDNGLSKRVRILSNLSSEELIDLYMHSLALIIPLDPNSIQDIARFSQKIAEYVSSGRPIITNNVGEIPYYFKDKESAIIVPYSVDGFTNAFAWSIKNKRDLDKIGELGYRVGEQKFDYIKLALNINEFFNKL